jgi:hypothetical protein
MSQRLTTKQRQLLMEAARRYKQFAKDGESLTQAQTGLGTVSQYKPVEDAGLMRACVNVGSTDRRDTIFWWKLTPEGAAIVRVIVSAMTLPQIWAEVEPLTNHKRPEEWPGQFPHEVTI